MKPIKVKDEDRQQIVAQFAEYLAKERFTEEKINYQVTLQNLLPKDLKKPVIRFTAETWTLMNAYVQDTDTEIGWHGTVTKEDNIYTITDVMLYPQYVTGATVNTEQAEYSNWLMSQPDEVFDNIRFQGHSHVSMGCSPSGVDQNFYDSILQTLTEGQFYIFMILNKRREYFITIYDFGANVIFEKSDIAIQVIHKNTDVTTYLNTEKAQYIKTKPVVVPPPPEKTTTTYTSDYTYFRSCFTDPFYASDTLYPYDGKKLKTKGRKSKYELK